MDVFMHKNGTALFAPQRLKGWSYVPAVEDMVSHGIHLQMERPTSGNNHSIVNQLILSNIINNIRF